MKLNELIKDLDVIRIVGDDVDVCDIAYSSADVRDGSCFIAISGRFADGHEYIDDAVSRGARAIVSERPLNLEGDVATVIVPDSRLAMAKMSARIFGEPSKDLTLVGVTGTNGKTTITYLLEAIFKCAGRLPGVIGTIDYRFGERVEKARHTTPESADLQKLLSKMRGEGVDACVMEVSSHALAQKRVWGCHFDAAIFTNLTPEHLDYHDDMEDYFEAKALFFEKLLSETGKQGAFAVINVDDPYGVELVDRSAVPVCTYGIDGECDVRGKNIAFDSNGLSMTVETPHGSFECGSRLCGRFNAQNILAAVAVAQRLGISIEHIRDAIEGVLVVPGRFESVSNERGILALVDYAHTPDALENVLKHARELAESSGGRLITVFGCGGDRDRTKRPLMGEVVGRLADIAIVTSDNPRTEKPEAIIEGMMPGIRSSMERFKDGSGYDVIVNRRDAIGRAVDIARVDDVIVVAGKGHEDYQILGTDRIHFDDTEVLKEFFGK